MLSYATEKTYTPVRLWVLVSILTFGCSQKSEPYKDAKLTVTSHSRAEASKLDALSTSVDVGVVFADRHAYTCVPLNRVGIMDADKVISVKSSCECVRPLIVEYYEKPTEIGRALRIDFATEPKVEDSPAAPVNLAVAVTFELEGGRAKTASIRFLHTTMVNRTKGTDP
jgi:hypothetical protein